MASGSVTPGTVEETVLARLLDTPDLQRLLRRSTSGACLVRGSAGDRVANRSIYNRHPSDGDDDLAAGAAFLDVPDSGRGLAERVGPVDGGCDLPGFDEILQDPQVRGVLRRRSAI